MPTDQRNYFINVISGLWGYLEADVLAPLRARSSINYYNCFRASIITTD